MLIAVIVRWLEKNRLKRDYFICILQWKKDGSSFISKNRNKTVYFKSILPFLNVVLDKIGL